MGAYADPRTPVGHPRRTYSDALAKLTTWAAKAKVRQARDLDRAQLAAFRSWLVKVPKHAAKRKGNRGEWKPTKQKRDPLSVNREVRAIKTFLADARKSSKLPKLDRDGIADTLAALPAPTEQPEYLAAAQLEKLLEACLRHDGETFAMTREEHDGLLSVGTTPRQLAVAPFAPVLLLTETRRGEALALCWDHVDLDALDQGGRKVGEIRLPAAITKTHRGRTIGLEVSPCLRGLLAAIRLRAGDAERAFEGHTPDLVTKARDRLVREFGAPRFDWQMLRSTCGTFLTNAPSIFGSAAAFMIAKQLGHSVVVAERHYARLLRGIPRAARTLDAAMRIESVMADVVEAVGSRSWAKSESRR